MGCLAGLLYAGFDASDDVILRGSLQDSVDFLPIFEENQCREPADLVCHGQIHAVAYIDLADFGYSFHFYSNLFDDGGFMRQGPKPVDQKSSSTGMGELVTSVSKLSSVISIVMV